MVSDLRSFLSQLEGDHPGEVVRVQKPVSTEYEITALVRELEAEGEAPVLIFENVEGSRFPVVVNLNGSLRRISASLGIKEDQLIPEYLRRTGNPIPPVRASDAPVQDVVLTGSEADLKRLPQIRHFENDGGAYITAGIVFARDPVTGDRNLSCHRLMFLGKDRLAIHMEPGKHLNECRTKAEEQGGALEVAISIGNHPAWHIGSLYIGAFQRDEAGAIGGLMEAPLELVEGKTVDLEVPARAEIVLEGEVVPGALTEEGPFSDFTGYAGERRDNRQVVRVKAITHRKDALFQDLTNGDSLEHLNLPVAGLLANLYGFLKAGHPTVENVRFVGPFMLAVSFRKRNEGQAQNLILRAFSGDIMLKYVIVVDEDVDVSRPEQVFWAVGARTQGDRDILIIPNTRGCDVDPSSAPEGIVTKVGIDATAKPNLLAHKESYPPRLPADIVNKVRSGDYLGSGVLSP
ncbi:MAG: UbiD family decarboxylase [Nitrospinota bacterium]